MGSMKSGPTLNPSIRTPRRRKAPRIPSTTEVLPTPLCVPATTTRGNFWRSTPIAISAHQPPGTQEDRQGRGACGVHDADRLRDASGIEGTDGISDIWPHILDTVVRIPSSQPDSQGPSHGGF